MNCIDNVVLFRLELRILSETHSIGVALVNWRSNLVNIFKLVLPVVEWLLLGLLSCIEGLNNPDLGTLSFGRCLDNVLLIIFSSTYGQDQTSMRLDQISLISKGTIRHSSDLKPAAVMFACISDDLSIDISLVLEDAKSMSTLLVSKG